MSAMRHGTRSAYVGLKCRCEACRAANNAGQREDRKRRSAADPALIPHGTVGGYTNWMCRCDECKQAKAATGGAS